MLVELWPGFVSDESSWPAIRGAASELVHACTLEGSLFTITRGGWTRTGNRNGIKISVKRAGTLGDNDDTVVSGEMEVAG